MKRIKIVLLTIMLASASVCWSQQTTTGFYYPTGLSSLGPYATWLDSGCPGGNGEYGTNYAFGKHKRLEKSALQKKGFATRNIYYEFAHRWAKYLNNIDSPEIRKQKIKHKIRIIKSKNR